MAVFIRGSSVQTSSMSNNSGLFIGQNIQHGWDSTSVDQQGIGYSMGDFSAIPCFLSMYWGYAQNWQTIWDNDMKGNYSLNQTR